MKVLVTISKEIEIEVSDHYSSLLEKYDNILTEELVDDITKREEIDGTICGIADADDPWNVLWEY